MEYLDLELVSEPKLTKRKNKPRIIPNLESVAEIDQEIILERIADVEKEIKTRKIRGPKQKLNPQKPEKIPKQEPEPTKVIFIKEIVSL